MQIAKTGLIIFGSGVEHLAQGWAIVDKTGLIWTNLLFKLAQIGPALAKVDEKYARIDPTWT